MEVLLKAVVAGVAGAILMLVLKKSNAELALVLALTVGLVVLGLALELFTGLRDFVITASEMAGLSSAVTAPVIKCVGIGVVTKLGSDLCRDAGASSVAGTLEITGAACALFIALPLMRALLMMVGELI